MSVPITRFTRPTMTDAMIVRISADFASSEVTAAQNDEKPSSRARQTTAASGMSTIRLR